MPRKKPPGRKKSDSRKIVDLVAAAAEPIVEEIGLELVEVEFVKEGAYWYLRVYIDHPGGVNHRHCEEVSYRLETILDQEEWIQHAYFFEVSSPGAERPLKKKSDYQRFQGRQIKVTTFAPIAGVKEFYGTLRGLENEQVIVESEKGITIIPLNQIASARLWINF